MGAPAAGRSQLAELPSAPVERSVEGLTFLMPKQFGATLCVITDFKNPTQFGFFALEKSKISQFSEKVLHASYCQLKRVLLHEIK